MVTANNIEDALKFYKSGADYVIMPHFLGGERVADIITEVRRRKFSLKKNRKDHIEELKSRRIIGHEHPSQLI
jgi:hypothetical protein